jgi:hypothetical protein
MQLQTLRKQISRSLCNCDCKHNANKFHDHCATANATDATWRSNQLVPLDDARAETDKALVTRKAAARGALKDTADRIDSLGQPLVDRRTSPGAGDISLPNAPNGGGDGDDDAFFVGPSMVWTPREVCLKKRTCLPINACTRTRL